MKVKATLKGNDVEFSQFIILKRREIEVEIELPDEDVQIYSKEELDRMTLDELAHLIWDKPWIDAEHINKPYKELLMDALYDMNLNKPL